MKLIERVELIGNYK